MNDNNFDFNGSGEEYIDDDFSVDSGEAADGSDDFTPDDRAGSGEGGGDADGENGGGGDPGVSVPVAKQKTVPLPALHQERRRRQDVEKRLEELEKEKQSGAADSGQNVPDEFAVIQNNAYHSMVNRGIDPAVAAEQAFVYANQVKTQRLVENMNLNLEAQGLTGNEYYAALSDPAVRKRVGDFAKSKMLTIEQAYNALYGAQRAREAAVESRISAVNAEKQTKKIPAVGGGGQGNSPAKKINLTAEQRWAADVAGMSHEEYFNMNKKE